MAHDNFQSDPSCLQALIISETETDQNGEFMTENSGGIRRKRLPTSCVQFTEQEYKRIQKMKDSLGLSIPDILRQNTFSRSDLESPLYTREDADRIIVELKRIGNNLNQIAHKINSGLMTGWSQSFNALWMEILNLRKQMGVNRGLR